MSVNTYRNISYFGLTVDLIVMVLAIMSFQLFYVISCFLLAIWNISRIRKVGWWPKQETQ